MGTYTFISGKMKALESVVLSFHHHWPLSYVANWLSEVHWHANTFKPIDYFSLS